MGNWRNFNQASTATGTFDLVQARSNNEVNEITGITETTGPSCVSPSYDPAGNTTAFPQIEDPMQSYQGTHGVWNRLAKVTNGSLVLREYQKKAIAAWWL